MRMQQEEKKKLDDSIDKLNNNSSTESDDTEEDGGSGSHNQELEREHIVTYVETGKARKQREEEKKNEEKRKESESRIVQMPIGTLILGERSNNVKTDEVTEYEYSEDYLEEEELE